MLTSRPLSRSSTTAHQLSCSVPIKAFAPIHVPLLSSLPTIGSVLEHVCKIFPQLARGTKWRPASNCYFVVPSKAVQRAVAYTHSPTAFHSLSKLGDGFFNYQLGLHYRGVLAQGNNYSFNFPPFLELSVYQISPSLGN